MRFVLAEAAGIHPVVWILCGLFALLTLNAGRVFLDGAAYDARRVAASRVRSQFLRDCLLRPDDMVGKLLDRIAENPIRWSLTMFGLAYGVGGSLYALVEDGDLVDGLWWAYISMTTVGYGDFSPETAFVRGLAMLVIIFGWAALLIMGNALGARITQKRIAAPHHRTPEIDDDLLVMRQRAEEFVADIDRLIPVVSDPRVVAALREIQQEEERHA
jgi:Ion channel